MRVELGNQNPIGLDHPSTTTVVIPRDASAAEAFRSITDSDGVWANHSNDERPAWIAVNDREFEQLLAGYYGSPVGRPLDWKDMP